MKRLILFLGVILPLLAAAQCTYFAKEIAKGDRFFSQTAYKDAIRSYTLALTLCPEKSEEAQSRIERVFDRIEDLRAQAEKAEKNASRQKQTAQKALLNLEIQQQKTDSALSIANRVLDQMYFYEGKFGLTLKNIETATHKTPKYRYGYIDREGREVIPFVFEEATPFSTEDGFARVKKEGKKYLLDTTDTGQTYLLAESLAELGPDTEALDLHLALPDNLPENLGDYGQLKIILAYGGFWNPGKLSQLPSSLGQLIQLKHLNLSYNQLGSLPPEIWKLTQLQELDLNGNQLTNLPPEIGELTQLKSLSLYGNQLTTLPPEIWKLTQLKSLSLTSTKLTTLPPEIGELTQLKSLNLESNQLSTLPPEIGKLTQLQTLNLEYNQLTNLPPEIGKLIQLKSLNLKFNQLTHLPPEIGELTQLQTLDLSSNQLTTLPKEIGELTQLQDLNLSGNPLTHLPPEIGKLTQLKDLDLKYNQLTHLPPEIGKLTQLQTLNLEYNQLTNLPPEIGKLIQLKSLTLSSNPLTHLPPEIGELTQLQELDLSANPLTHLPPEIGKLTQLKDLDLRRNQLTNLPPEIGNLPNLHYLGLNGNPIEWKQLAEFIESLSQNVRFTKKAGFQIPDSSQSLFIRVADTSLYKIPEVVFWRHTRQEEWLDFLPAMATNFDHPEFFLQLADTVLNSSPAPEVESVTQIITTLNRLGIEYKEQPKKLLQVRVPYVLFCEKAVERFPESDKLALHLSYAYRRLRDAQAGLDEKQAVLETCLKRVAYCEKTVERFPESEEVAMELSDAYSDLSFEAYFELRDYQNALKTAQKNVLYCEESVQKFPASKEVLNYLGVQLGNLAFNHLYNQQPAEAETAARRGLGLTKGVGYANTSLIHAYLLQGKIDAAKAHYQTIGDQHIGAYAMETLKEALLRQLASMEQAGIFEGDNSHVAAFRAFLEE